MKIWKKLTALLTLAGLLFSLAVLPVSAETNGKTISFQYGDIDGNGSRNTTDALMTLRYAVGKITISDLQKKSGDVNASGKTDTTDALMILRLAVGKMAAFPAGSSGEYTVSGTGYDWLTPAQAQTCRAQLTEVQKQCYDQISAAISAVSTAEFTVGTTDQIDGTTLSLAFSAVRCDHPEYFWMPSSFSYLTYSDHISMQFSEAGTENTAGVYLYSAARIPEMTQVLDARVEGILQSIFNYRMNESERSLAIHDWLCNNLTYDQSAAANPDEYPEAFTAWGALQNGKAVCQGYAEAYQLLLERSSVLSVEIVGTIQGGPHMWNAIRLDGKWAFADSTLDDSNIAGQPLHFACHVSASILTKTHTISPDLTQASATQIAGGQFNFIVPACETDSECPIKKAGGLFATTAEFTEAAPQRIASAAAAGKTNVEFFILDTTILSTAQVDALNLSQAITAANVLIDGQKITSYRYYYLKGSPGLLLSWQ